MYFVYLPPFLSKIIKVRLISLQYKLNVMKPGLIIYLGAAKTVNSPLLEQKFQHEESQFRLLKGKKKILLYLEFNLGKLSRMSKSMYI